MEKICSICAKDPSAHSFKKISEKNGICIFYTKPSNATKYNDTDGTISHITNALHEIGSKKWIWIFDGDGFEMQHTLELNTGRKILELIEKKYQIQLQQIIFINPSWHIKGILKTSSMVLNDNIKSKIKLLDDRVYTILEFI